MSKVTHYTVGFGEKTQICTFEVPILLVTVYVAPSNKGKQLYEQCFAIMKRIIRRIIFIKSLW